MTRDPKRTRRITQFPTYEETLYLHGKLIERFGGSGGIRDPGLLQSALARPRSGYYESLSLQAAALMQSLAQNHALVDGNKRVAFALTGVFLRINGFRLVVNVDDAENFVISRLIGARASLEEISSWLEKHMRPE